MVQALLGGIRSSPVGEAETGQGDTCEAIAKFLQRASPSDGLSQVFGQFIEFFVHNLPFV